MDIDSDMAPFQNGWVLGGSRAPSKGFGVDIRQLLSRSLEELYRAVSLNWGFLAVGVRII